MTASQAVPVSQAVPAPPLAGARLGRGAAARADRAAAIALTLPMLRLLTSPVFRIKDMPPAMPSSPTHLSVSAEPG